MIEGFDIVCISTSDWKYPWGSRQQLMSRLSRKNRVLFIEYQASFLHIFKYSRILLNSFTCRIRHVNDNLTVYRPWLNLPFGNYFQVVNSLNQKLLYLQLNKLIRQLKFKNVLFWVFEPTFSAPVKKLNGSTLIYHCIDSFKLEKKSALRRKCIDRLEWSLCHKCDIIFASTEDSLREKRVLNKESHLITSGVDESFFLSGGYCSSAATEGLKDIPKPLIGFIGTVDTRVDFELIDFIARVNPEWSIILVGRIIDNKLIKNLKEKMNVHICGHKNHESLPDYIRSFDAAIAPYRVTDYTKGVSSIKIYEYLALGKAVVATRIPSLQPLKDAGLIKLAASKEEFLEGLKDCLRDDSLTARKARIEFAKLNTWGGKVEVASKIISDYLKGKSKNHA